MALSPSSSAWLGIPQAQTASYCASRVAHVVGASRSSVLDCMRRHASMPAFRLDSEPVKNTPRYPSGLGSGVPTAPITSGAQPCMPAAPWGADDASTSLPDDIRPDQGDLLGDEAADGESEQIDLAELLGLEEGDGVACHLLDGARRGSAATAHSGVVERDDTARRGERVDQCGIPVVEVSPEMLEQNEWQHPTAGFAIDEVDPVGRADALVRGRLE